MNVPNSNPRASCSGPNYPAPIPSCARPDDTTSNAVTFSAPGTYQFYCMVHPQMHGTVIVQ